MKKEDIALALLKMLTKRRFCDKDTKQWLKLHGYISEKGNVAVQGKRFVWDYYGEI